MFVGMEGEIPAAKSSLNPEITCGRELSQTMIAID